MPLFSIIIPTYNRAHLIAKTLHSVLNQEFNDFEVVVVDDGSTDNTEEVVKNLLNPKIRYFKKENAERGAARNFGIKQTKGHFITFLDSDDLLYPNHFSQANKIISDKPDIEVFHQAYEMLSTEGKVISKFNTIQNPANEALLRGNHLSCIGVFIKKEILESLNFSENRNFSGTEDWLLWLQIAARHTIHTYNTIITSAMVNHEERSVLTFNEEKYLYRSTFLYESLKKDAQFVEKFGLKGCKTVYAHMLTYTALHASMVNHKKIATKYLLKGLSLNFGELYSKRFLAIVKKIILS